MSFSSTAKLLTSLVGSERRLGASTRTPRKGKPSATLCVRKGHTGPPPARARLLSPSVPLLGELRRLALGFHEVGSGLGDGPLLCLLAFGTAEAIGKEALGRLSANVGELVLGGVQPFLGLGELLGEFAPTVHLLKEAPGLPGRHEIARVLLSRPKRHVAVVGEAEEAGNGELAYAEAPGAGVFSSA